MNKYADLLREAQARKQAEHKLQRIAELHATDYVNSGDDQERYEQIQQILNGES